MEPSGNERRTPQFLQSQLEPQVQVAGPPQLHEAPQLQAIMNSSKVYVRELKQGKK